MVVAVLPPQRLLRHRPADTTPPETPRLGAPAVDGGRVRVPVTAERGARLQIASGGTVVHSASATGDEQELVLDLTDGSHAIEVTATDAAGNRSTAATFRVTLDTTPPEPAEVEVVAVTTPGAPTTLTIRGERSATYDLQVSGPRSETAKGRLTGGDAEAAWQLPNGDYAAIVTLTDGAKNVSSATEVAFTVDLPSPQAPALRLVSDTGSNPVVIAITAPGAENVDVSLLAGNDAHEQTIALDDAGAGTAEFTVDDGSYGLTAIASDFQGQHSEPAALDGIVVKTSPPALALAFAEELLSTGIFGYELTADEGATVLITSATKELLAEFAATGRPQDFSIEVPGGDYAITVAVVDAFGNETVQEFAAQVSTPSAAAGVVVLLVLLAMIVGAGVGARRLWRGLRGSSPKSSVPTVPPPAAS